MNRPLRAELVEPATRRRRTGAGPPPRSQRVARRTDACTTRASGPRLVRPAVAFTGESPQVDGGDERLGYSLHWISPYENDVWD